MYNLHICVRLWVFLFNTLEADNENHNQQASIHNNLNAKRFSASKDKNENVWHTPLLDEIRTLAH